MTRSNAWSAAGDRPRLLLALLIELPATLPQPPTPALLAVDRTLTIKIERNDRLPSVQHLASITSHLALGVKLALGLPQRHPPPLRRGQLLRQLIAARVTVQLILALVVLIHLRQQLARDPLIAAVRVHRRVRRDLRTVDRDHADLHQARLLTQPQHVGEQLSQRRLVPLAELRDRRVIRNPLSGDHHECNILAAFPLDTPRRTHALRAGVEQQRHHHLRVIRRPAVTVRPVHLIERGQVHLLNRRQNRPDQVVRRHPIQQRRRQQHHLLAVARDEVLRHALNYIKRAGWRFARQPPGKRRSCPGVRGEASRDPRDMAKAGLLEAESPEDEKAHPPERHLLPAPCSAMAFLQGHRNLWGHGALPSEGN